MPTCCSYSSWCYVGVRFEVDDYPLAILFKSQIDDAFENSHTIG
jgi:hypothetical protein